MALTHIKDNKPHKKTMYWLRNRFVNECNVPKKVRSFMLNTPKHVREGAVKDLATAYKSNFTVKKQNPSHTFDIRFRRKKDAQSIVIPKASIKVCKGGVIIYPKMLSKDPIELRGRPDLREIGHDCRLVMDTFGRFVLCVPVDVPTRTIISDNQANEWTVSVDPGVRTFATCWSPDKTAWKLGDGNASRMYRLLLHMDSLKSKIAKAESLKKKSRLDLAYRRARRRYDNIIKDMHYQIANFLVKRYSKIVLPKFGSKAMSSKLNRRLHTKTVRSMLGLGHYAFRQRLLSVAERYGVEVDICTEEYTSKTCSSCGWIHPTLGGSKVYKCRSCGLCIDRDLNGAFNIYLKRWRESESDLGTPPALPPARACAAKGDT